MLSKLQKLAVERPILRRKATDSKIISTRIGIVRSPVNCLMTARKVTMKPLRVIKQRYH